MKSLSFVKLMVLENEPSQLEILEFFLRRIGIKNMQSADNYQSAIELFKSYQPDVVLLDIELGEKHSGIDVARFIKSEGNTPFLFITSNFTSNMYEQARKLQPRSFISKDLNELSLRQAIELALIHLPANTSSIVEKEIKEQVEIESGGNVDSDFYVKSGTKYKKVSLDEILWVEVDGRYSTIKTTDGKKTLINSSLKETAERLPSEKFYRIHQSFIINLDRVESVDVGEDIVSVAGESLPLGRNFKKSFLGRMKKF